MIEGAFLFYVGSFAQMWLQIMILSWAFDYPYTMKQVVGVWVLYHFVSNLLKNIGINAKKITKENTNNGTDSDD